MLQFCGYRLSMREVFNDIAEKAYGMWKIQDARDGIAAPSVFNDNCRDI